MHVLLYGRSARDPVVRTYTQVLTDAGMTVAPRNIELWKGERERGYSLAIAVHDGDEDRLRAAYGAAAQHISETLADLSSDWVFDEDEEPKSGPQAGEADNPVVDNPQDPNGATDPVSVPLAGDVALPAAAGLEVTAKFVPEPTGDEVLDTHPDACDWRSMQWFQRRAYIAHWTGEKPTNKAHAVALMAEAGYGE